MEARALRKKQNSRKPYRYSNIYSASIQHHLQHLIIVFGMSKLQFPTQHSFSPPIINASRRTSNHTLTAATTKTPLSPLVDQILKQPALGAGEMNTDQATAPMEEILKDEAESFKKSVLFCHLFILCLMILIQILTTLTLTIQGKTERKRELTKKFRTFTSYRRKSFCY